MIDIKKKIRKIRGLYKSIKVLKGVFRTLVRIIGPAMSVYLFIEDKMKKK